MSITKFKNDIGYSLVQSDESAGTSSPLVLDDHGNVLHDSMLNEPISETKEILAEKAAQHQQHRSKSRSKERNSRGASP